jgi:type IV pilus assembly protein PilO
MFNRIFDLPPAQRLFIYGGAALLILFLYIFWYYLPTSQQFGEKQQRLTKLQTERAKLEALLNNRAKAENAVSEAEADFNRVKAQLPEGKEIPELLRQVSNLGRESGLEIVLFRQKLENFQELYAEVPVEMAVRGNYHQVALFFDKARGLDRIVNMSDIGIKNPRLVDGQVQLEASFFAKTYRFLTEEERERIAKEQEAAGKKKGRRK